jgi:hypothetical protein
VLPGPVDTPLFGHAANHTGRQLRAIPPASAPERVAAAVVRCARRPRPEVVVGATARAIVVARRVAPLTTDRLVATWSARLLLRHVDEPASDGSLFDAPADGQVYGGWRILGARRALGERFGKLLARRGAPPRRLARNRVGTAEGPE